MKIRNGFISNSSSSCFVCNTKMSAKEVVKKLHQILKGYNIMTDEQNHYGDIFGAVHVAGKFDMEHLKHYTNDDIKGKLLIYSASDNAIPYELFDLIENTFEGRRIHLG